MIPITIELENLGSYEFDALEYKYLTEISQEIKDRFQKHKDERYSDRNNKLDLFTDNGFNIYRYLGKIGDSNIFANNTNDLYTASIEEDFIYLDRGYSKRNWAIVINEELFKEIVNKRFDCNYPSFRDVIDIFEKYENKQLDFGDFVQKFLAYKYKEENRERKKQEIKAIEKENESKGTIADAEQFKNGLWRDGESTHGIDNTIYLSRREYVLSKKINKAFTIQELNDEYLRYNYSGTCVLSWIESLCVEKGIGYIYISSDKKKSYKVKFKDDKMYVDNVCIPKSRASFFISRATGDTEKLKQFKELSAIKGEFLGVKEIQIYTDFYNYIFPIEVECIDKKFKIEFMDKVVTFDWKQLEPFRYSLQRLRTRFSTSDIPTLNEMFGISKAEMFDYMKKIQILDKLGDEDEND